MTRCPDIAGALQSLPLRSLEGGEERGGDPGMTVGNLAAINQSNVKRLLAYSSISHAGYILLGLVAGNETGIKGIEVYLMVYTFMNLGAFLVLVALRRQKIRKILLRRKRI